MDAHPLKKWRTREKLTQREAAALIGVSQSRYAELEAGASCPIKRAQQIQKATGIPLARLIDAVSKAAA